MARKKQKLGLGNLLGDEVSERMVAISELAKRDKLQPRAAFDDQLAEEYALNMHASSPGARVLNDAETPWPPIEVWRDEIDGETFLFLGDGYHRVEAASRAGLTHFQALIRPGSLRDAWMHSLGANAEHGKRRTNADKRRAVEQALGDATIAAMSSRRIAKICKVSKTFIDNMRAELGVERDTVMVERGGTVYEMDTSDIGAAPKRREGGALVEVEVTKTKAPSSPREQAKPRYSDTSVTFERELDEVNETFDLIATKGAGVQAWRELADHHDRLLSSSGHLALIVRLTQAPSAIMAHALTGKLELVSMLSMQTPEPTIALIFGRRGRPRLHLPTQTLGVNWASRLLRMLDVKRAGRMLDSSTDIDAELAYAALTEGAHVTLVSTSPAKERNIKATLGL